MTLPQKQFDDFVNDQAAAMQASSSSLLDFSVGSILRALIEANAGNALWLEGLCTTLLAVTRLTTSHGEDVDTFVEQFGLERNAATPAFGEVTFSRFTTTTQATIAAGTLDPGTLNLLTQGALVYSSANQVTYSVYADDSNPNYDPDLNAYVVPIDTASIDVPVIAITAGAVGNVFSNQITTIASVIVGIDTVTNDQPFSNGENQESDSALKIRFVLYLNSLSKATEQAIEAAVAGVEGVARYKIVENEDILGNVLLGFFYVVIDDGSGAASGTLLSNVQTAVGLVRGLTIAYSIYAPDPVPISISAHVFTDGTIPDDTVQTAALDALESYITDLGFDSLIAYSEIPRIIYDVNTSLSGNKYSPIINVNNYTLNGGTSDITLVGREIATDGTLTVIMNA